MLQFITSSKSQVPVAEQVRRVIEGGCRWIQIDMPDATDEEIGKVVEEIKPLCIEKEAFLIFTGKAELAKTLDVGGTLLGKKDMLPSQARLLLGPAAVIGVVAETEGDIDAIQALDIDYVSFPFSLGIDKIGELCKYMENKELVMGRVAAGDISIEEVTKVMDTGVNGIAVSDPIALDTNITAITQQYLKCKN